MGHRMCECAFMRACIVTFAREGDHDRYTGKTDLFPLVMSSTLLLECLLHFRHNVNLIISFLHFLSDSAGYGAAPGPDYNSSRPYSADYRAGIDQSIPYAVPTGYQHPQGVVREGYSGYSGSHFQRYPGAPGEVSCFPVGDLITTIGKLTTFVGIYRVEYQQGFPCPLDRTAQDQNQAERARQAEGRAGCPS
jgi:hypothetical protein